MTSGRRGRSASEGGAASTPTRVERVVVDAVSFMHEQSETLAELDRELREQAEEAGLEFHRVPVPWEDPRFASVLADLAEPLLADLPEPLLADPAEPPLADPAEPPPTDRDPEGLRFAACRCRPGASCLNAAEQPAFAMRA